MSSSPAATLSSSFLQSFCSSGSNEASKLLGDRKTAFVVVVRKKAEKIRKIILKEDTELLGKKGQVLDVRAGYYRNYLLPLGMAQIVTPTLFKSQSFTNSGFGPRTVIICDQCEKEYHVDCLRDHKMANLKELPEGKWFCCVDCDHIHSVLEKMVGQGEQELPDSLVDIVRKKLEEKDPTSTPNLDIRWRVLNAKMDKSSESLRLLYEAEQFDPIIGAYCRDLIPTTVYGMNINGKDYSGMFSVILLVDEEVVSTALLRIFGVEIAELPLVATTEDCEGQGYFQSLFLCVERLLASLKVKKLVIPVADDEEESISIWTKKFKFEKPTPEELMELKQHRMIFKGPVLLQKLVPTIDLKERKEGS